MKFFKYQGTGNDFILIEDYDGKAPKRADLAIKLCDRRFGIGADGILYLGAARDADASMRILNSDGSEAEMCGNGIRCLAKHLFDSGRVKKRTMTIATAAGIKKVECDAEQGKVRSVTVEMGPPILDCQHIPMLCDGRFVDRAVDVDGRAIKGTAVSMGNPHLVIFEKLSEQEKEDLGPKLERNKLFPKRTNVEFAEVHSGFIKVRVYERGAAWTLACGTGACATVVAAALNGLAPEGREEEIRLPGGSLWIKVGEGLSTVTMRGPAELVYIGEIGE